MAIKDIGKLLRHIIELLKAVFAPIWRDLGGLPILGRVFTLMIIVAYIITCVLALVFLILAIVRSINYKSNPLNIDLTAYQAIRGPFLGQVPYGIPPTIDVGLGVLGFVLVGFAYWWKVKGKIAQMPQTMGTLVVLALVGWGLALVLWIAYAAGPRRKYRDGERHINEFNTYVYDHMPLDANVLTPLSSVPLHFTDISNAIRQSLGAVPADATAQEVARAFFAVNMYQLYLDMGLENPNLAGALGMFQPYQQLVRLASPADYLPAQRVFINDYSDNFYQYLPAPLSDASTPFAIEVSILASRWTTEANNRAQEIQNYSVVGYFVIITLSALLQMALVYVLMILYQKQTSVVEGRPLAEPPLK